MTVTARSRGVTGVTGAPREALLVTALLTSNAQPSKAKNPGFLRRWPLLVAGVTSFRSVTKKISEINMLDGITGLLLSLKRESVQ